MKRLLIIQSRIQHYRIPVFDKLNKSLQNDYKFFVTGGSKNGNAFGDIKRDYIHGLSLNHLFKFHYWKGILKKIKELNPDVIITTASPRNLSLYLIIFYSYYKKIRLIGWSKVNSKVSNNNNFYKKIFYNFFKELIVYGKKSAQELREIGYFGKYVIANNTIDIDLIENNQNTINEITEIIYDKYKIKDKKVILFLGRLDSEKRPLDLIIFEEILSDDKNNFLVFVGDGPEKKNLENFQKYSKYKNQILITGRVPNYFDYAWIKLSQVYIVPGQVGLAIKQAMFLKTPVIIANEDGVDAEVVEDEFTGLRYEKGNHLELITKYKKLINNNDLRKNIVNNSYNLIKNDHTLLGMINSILKFL